MAKRILYDNDIVLKICAYDLVGEAFATLGSDFVSILPSAQFSLRDQARRTMRVTDRDGLTSKVDRFIARADLIEPTGDEIALAARLEESALRAAVQLDTGESQLVALLISRKLPLMLTGDKRAIVALHVINVTDASRRIGCLEQLIHAIIETVPLDRIRAKICAEPQMDKTLTICFACASDTVALESVRECLMSYSRDLESHSGTILIDRPLSQR